MISITISIVMRMYMCLIPSKATDEIEVLKRSSEAGKRQ